MKKVFIGFLILVAIASCTKKNEETTSKESLETTVSTNDTTKSTANVNNKSIMGSWKLVRAIANGKDVESDGNEKIKFYTTKSFYWLTYNSETKIMRRSMGGTYSFDGTNLVEVIKVVGVGKDELNALNSTAEISVTIDGDNMHIKIPNNAGGVWEEDWVRFEQQ